MKKRHKKKESLVCYLIVGIMAFLCFLPLWITFASSISNETAIVRNGFSLLPQEPTLETYRYILKDKGTMIIRHSVFRSQLFSWERCTHCSL